jgi:hypothetical protein
MLMATKRTRPSDNKFLLYGGMATFVISYFWLDLSGRYLMNLTNNLRFLIDLPIIIIGIWIGLSGATRVRGDKKVLPIIGLGLCSLALLFILWAFAVFNLS